MVKNKKATCYDLCDIYIDTKCNKNNSATYMLQNDKIKCSANQWTGFYMITAPVMKELK